jgi:phage gpG-like protein
MDGQEFANHLLKLSTEVENFINNDSPEIMGKLAVDHFKESFQDEGFTDAAFEKWDEVKRRLNPKTKGAKASRKILTGDTGDLGMSIDYKNAANGQVTLYSDKAYADAHNSGTTTAGRSRNVRIPKRQFIGDSEVLNQKITEKLTEGLDNTIKKAP